MGDGGSPRLLWEGVSRIHVSFTEEIPIDAVLLPPGPDLLTRWVCLCLMKVHLFSGTAMGLVRPKQKLTYLVSLVPLAERDAQTQRMLR